MAILSKSYDSISLFYDDLKNHKGNDMWDFYANGDRKDFSGLSLAGIKKHKYSFPFGVEKLRELTETEVESSVKVRYYNQFDGFDINIDRMYDGLDFLIDERKISKLPRTIDLYVNVGESCAIEYQAMLNKTYTTLKIVDHLESLGVRVAVWVCIYTHQITTKDDAFLEIAVKQYSDPVNLGALCTTISPWFFRHWIFLWLLGRAKVTDDGMGYPFPLPKNKLPKNAIIIETKECHTMHEANKFISGIKINQLQYS